MWMHVFHAETRDSRTSLNYFNSQTNSIIAHRSKMHKGLYFSEMTRPCCGCVYVCLQDSVRLLPQHRLVHAHPRHGHVQRDPHLRHDKWHLLQVRRRLSSLLILLLLKNVHKSTKLRKLDSQSQRLQPIAASRDCSLHRWNTFPVLRVGLNGWISMLKSILASLCCEYHYVFLPRIPSRLQSPRRCGWLGCSTQFLLS